MVYISNWQEFQEAAESLYKKSPVKTRYCVKWRAAEGHLVLKITDDNTCIKYKTHSSIFLNRFEALNLSLMRQMHNTRPTSRTQAADSSSAQRSGPIQNAPSVMPTSIPTTVAHAAVTAASSPATAGVKKKKPNKKK